MLLVMYTQRDRLLTGRNDFVQLWVGANLVGTPALYDMAANDALEIKTIGVRLEGVSHSRPPFYAFLLKPLGRLPYLASYVLFQTLGLACLGVFLWFNLKRLPDVALFSCISLPLVANFLNGQDLALVLAFLTISLALFRSKHDVAGGLVLALCAIKFHLFLPLPLVFLVHRRWRALAGSALGALILGALSFLAQGRDWISTYYTTVLRNSAMNPGVDLMPNLHGALFDLGIQSATLELGLAVVILGMVAYLAWRETDLELGLAYALIGGLLVSYHAYIQDSVVLLPAVVAIMLKASGKLVRHLMTIAMLPPVYLLILAGKPFSLALPILLIVILAAASSRSVVQQQRELA